MPKPELFGIDELRKAVRLFDGCNETFNQRFTPDQLITLARACWASGWDYSPDSWTEEQIQAALKGEVPRWDDAGEPLTPEAYAN